MKAGKIAVLVCDMLLGLGCLNMAGWQTWQGFAVRMSLRAHAPGEWDVAMDADSDFFDGARKGSKMRIALLVRHPDLEGRKGVVLVSEYAGVSMCTGVCQLVEARDRRARCRVWRIDGDGVEMPLGRLRWRNSGEVLEWFATVELYDLDFPSCEECERFLRDFAGQRVNGVSIGAPGVFVSMNCEQRQRDARLKIRIGKLSINGEKVPDDVLMRHGHGTIEVIEVK